VLKTGIYKHYKGNLYKVIAVARHSETEEEFVVYQALYDEHGIWIRPKKMFMEELRINGQYIPRFAFIREEKIVF